MTPAEILVEPAVAEAYPGTTVLASAARVGDTSAVARAAEDRWRELYDRWHAAEEAELLGHPHIRAYRALARAVGLEPDRHPPSVQALVDRGLRGRPPGAWPRINPIVDAVNVVAVRTLTSLGVFDADRLQGPVRLALTGGGEPFVALGAKRPAVLEADQLVLRDDARVLSLFARRDGIHQAVRADSARVLLLGCVVPGVERSAIAAALAEAGELLAGAPPQSPKEA